MIYFLIFQYKPNTASTNRILSYINSLEILKIPVRVLFVMPDTQFSKIEGNYQYVTINYCWTTPLMKIKIFKYLSLIVLRCIIMCQMKTNDKIYVYGNDGVLNAALKKRGTKVFFEKTESPEVNIAGTYFYKPSLMKHIQMCRRVDALFVISSQLKNYYVSQGVPADRIHIINMTVDPERFMGLSKTNEKEKYIAYCGTASNNKDGVDQLIRAFSIVNKRFPNVKLYIVGETPSASDESGNLRLIEELGLKDSILFTGIVRAEKMPQLLKDAEILALARPNNIQAQYGFPTKLGEYLLTGNPVVVTAVGDIPLFLEDGKNAIIVKPDDPNKFGERLLWALEHPDECKVIGKNGKEQALKSFNALNETRKIIETLNNC